MSTNSLIGVTTEKGIRCVYCHWDGYPEYVGALLKEFYTTSTTIFELMNMGDLSSLGTKPITQYKWNKLTDEEKGARHENGARLYTLSYRNWRDENCPSKLLTIEQFDAYSIEYKYLFNGFKWECWNEKLDVMLNLPIFEKVDM